MKLKTSDMSQRRSSDILCALLLLVSVDGDGDGDYAHRPSRCKTLCLIVSYENSDLKFDVERRARGSVVEESINSFSTFTILPLVLI
jgi:hypothetical protein